MLTSSIPSAARHPASFRPDAGAAMLVADPLADATPPPHADNPLAATIARLGTPIDFGRNAEIFGEHEPADYFYQVVSGAVRTYKVLSDGRRQIGAFYLPGDIFGLEPGELILLRRGDHRRRLLLVRRRAVEALAERDGAVARQLWALTRVELERVQEHILLLVKTARERVASFLLEMAGRVAPARMPSSTCPCRARISPIISASPSRPSRARSPASNMRRRSACPARGHRASQPGGAAAAQRLTIAADDPPDRMIPIPSVRRRPGGCHRGRRGNPLQTARRAIHAPAAGTLRLFKR